jgi:hypothetical protein
MSRLGEYVYGILLLACIVGIVIVVTLDNYNLFRTRCIDNLSTTPIRVHVIILYSDDTRLQAQLKAVRNHMSSVCKDITVLYKLQKPNDDVKLVQYKTDDPFLELPNLLSLENHILWLGNNVIPITTIYASTFMFHAKWIVCNTPIDSIVLGVQTPFPIPLIPLHLSTIHECGSLENIWKVFLSRVDVIFDGGHIGVVSRFTGIPKVDEAIIEHALQMHGKHRKKQRWMIVYSDDESVFSQLFV